MGTVSDHFQLQSEQMDLFREFLAASQNNSNRDSRSLKKGYGSFLSDEELKLSFRYVRFTVELPKGCESGGDIGRAMLCDGHFSLTDLSAVK